MILRSMTVIADIENWLVTNEMEASWHSPVND